MAMPSKDCQRPMAETELKLKRAVTADSRLSGVGRKASDQRAGNIVLIKNSHIVFLQSVYNVCIYALQMFIDVHLKLFNKTVSMSSCEDSIGDQTGNLLPELSEMIHGNGVIKMGGGEGRLPVELRRPGITQSQWGANTGGSRHDLDISLVQIPATVEFEHRREKTGQGLMR